MTQAATTRGTKPAHDAPVAPDAEWLRQTWQTLRQLCYREWFLVAAGSAVLAVVMTWPLALHATTAFYHDNADPAEYAWILSWPGHVLLHHPSQLWNGNLFYPAPDSLAFTDTGLGYLPASFLGDSPTTAVLRFNLLFMFAFALTFAGTYALARQLGARWPGALLAGAAFAYAPWHLAQWGHITVISTGGVALALAALARGHGFSLRSGYRPDRVRPKWIAAGWAIAAWQMTLGFAIGVPFFYVLIILGAVTAAGWLLARRPRLTRAMGWANGLGILGFGLVTYAMARVSLRVAERYDIHRTYTELGMYSPRPGGLLSPPPTSWLWGNTLSGLWHNAAAGPGYKGLAEVTWLPGFALLACALGGVALSVFALRWRALLAVSAALLALLSMGTELFGGALYMVLYRHVPGWDAIRTPGRLMIWATLALAILAAGFLTRLWGLLQQRWQQRTVHPGPTLRWALTLAMVLPTGFALLEGVSTSDLHPVPQAPPTLATLSSSAQPVLVLPSQDRYDCIAMYWTVSHYQRMTNGCGSVEPPTLAQIRWAAVDFPNQKSIRLFQKLGIRSVVVIKKDIPGSMQKDVLTHPVTGLPITRRETKDAVIFTIKPRRS